VATAAVVAAVVGAAAVVAAAVVVLAVVAVESPQAANTKLSNRVKRTTTDPVIFLFITPFLLLWLTLV